MILEKKETTLFLVVARWNNGISHGQFEALFFIAYLRSLHRFHSRHFSADFRVGIDCASQTDLYDYKRRHYPTYLDVGVIQNNLNTDHLSDTRGGQKKQLTLMMINSGIM